LKNSQQNNFNLIRFLLASFVVFCHNIELLEGNKKNEFLKKIFGTLTMGDFSVVCFFILSGYLIVKSWDKNSNAKIFLGNRILRIYPGFIGASIISCFVFGAFAGNNHYFEEFNFRQFFINLLFLERPLTPEVFKNSTVPNINASMWTIEHEFKCYLLVLLLGVSSFIKNKIGWLMFFITFFAIVGISNHFDIRSIQGLIKANLNIPLIYSFAIGGTFYLFGKKIFNKKILYILSGILLLICFYDNNLVTIGLPIFGGYILLSFAELHIPILKNFNKVPDISYGIYLYGWPISKLLIHYQPKISYLGLNIESYFLAILFGILSWYLIEKPFISLKKKNITVNILDKNILVST